MQRKHPYAIELLTLILLLGVAACATSDGMSEQKMKPTMGQEMNAMEGGMLMGRDGHNAAGKVTVDMGMGDAAILTLSDIEVDRVPDGIVYLTRNADYRDGVELGRLDRFTGTVSFAIPAGVDPDEYDSVVIWCRKFDVEIGRAYLPKKMM